MRHILPILLSLACAPALADEVWDTDQGEIIYLDDRADVAIWEGSIFGEPVRLYFPGLAGNYSQRGVHEGFWVQGSGLACGAMMTGPDGMQGGNWGRLTLIFDEPEFPSDWTLLRGLCFDAPVEPLRGRARTAP